MVIHIVLNLQQPCLPAEISSDRQARLAFMLVLSQERLIMIFMLISLAFLILCYVIALSLQLLIVTSKNLHFTLSTLYVL